MDTAIAFELGGRLMAVTGMGATWILAAGQVLNIRSNLIHQTSHNRLLRSKLKSRFVAEALGIVVLAPPVDVYKATHLGTHHRPEKVASDEDDDVAFIRWLGFRPGMKAKDARKHFFRLLLAPPVHVRLLGLRLLENFAGGHPLRRAAALAWWTTVLAFAATHGLCAQLILGYLIPITIVYHIGLITYVVSEHMHFTHPPGDKSRDWHSAVSHARFLGAALPPSSLPLLRRIRAWTGWLGDMLGAFVVRILVLPGELITHSAHHWRPGQADWTRAPYAYRDLKARWPKEKVREFWGLRATLNAVFKGFEDSSDTENARS